MIIFFYLLIFNFSKLNCIIISSKKVNNIFFYHDNFVIKKLRFSTVVVKLFEFYEFSHNIYKLNVYGTFVTVTNYLNITQSYTFVLLTVFLCNIFIPSNPYDILSVNDVKLLKLVSKVHCILYVPNAFIDINPLF